MSTSGRPVKDMEFDGLYAKQIISDVTFSKNIITQLISATESKIDDILSGSTEPILTDLTLTKSPLASGNILTSDVNGNATWAPPNTAPILTDLTLNKGPLASGNVLLSNISGNATWSKPLWPIFRTYKYTTNSFNEGIGPFTNSSNTRFTCTLNLPTKVNQCWLVMDGLSGYLSVDKQVSVPGCPAVERSGDLIHACFVTTDYTQATRLNSTETYLKEKNPTTLTDLTLWSDPVGQSYTSLGNWLYGTYGTDNSTYILGNYIAASNLNYYVESIYIDNSNTNSVLVFCFRTTIGNITSTNFSPLKRIWVHVAN